MKKENIPLDQKNGLFNRFLNGVEVIGNKLPHPATIFVILSALVIVVSEIAFRMQASVNYYDARAKADVTVQAVSLLNAAGLRYMFVTFTKNFTTYAPLGTVLVAMLGVGVAEETGLINAVLKKVVLSTPKRFITAIVVLMGVLSNIASDAGYVVLIPLGAIVFLSFGRHPLAGIAAAFAGVSGGFSANLLLGTLDPLLAGITNEAIKIGGSAVKIEATANYFFMIVSTFLLTFVGTWITEKVVEPRLGSYKGKHVEETMVVSKEESRGLIAALITMILFVAIMIFLTVPEFGWLRSPILEDGVPTGKTTLDPFVQDGLVPTIGLFFLLPGIFYGRFAGTVKKDKDVINGMSKAMSTMGSFLVLAFTSAQFINYFLYSKLGIILAVSGANFLKGVGFVGLPLVIAFVILSAFINLFIGSASAKWAIMAPVFVPMLMLAGITPEFTQLAYRIGDSSTNIISPLMTYYAVIITFVQKYDEDSGIGTLVSTMLPYSIAFLFSWILLMILWYFTGLPIGPDAFMR